MSIDFTYWADTISDTPIFNALAAAHRPTTHRAPAALSRSCVVSRRSTGGRHHRSAAHAEHPHGSGRHRLAAV